MTYESLLNDFRAVYEWFYASFQRLLFSVEGKPLVKLGLFVIIALPALYFLFDFILSLSDSGEDMINEGYKIYKQFKRHNINSTSKETRKAFHKTKNSFNQKKLKASIEKWDNVPLSKNFINPAAYNIITNYKKVNSSSPSHQGSSANIDVEVDDD